VRCERRDLIGPPDAQGHGRQDLLKLVGDPVPGEFAVDRRCGGVVSGLQRSADGRDEYRGPLRADHFAGQHVSLAVPGVRQADRHVDSDDRKRPSARAWVISASMCSAK
jgi:hypothetical protein